MILDTKLFFEGLYNWLFERGWNVTRFSKNSCIIECNKKDKRFKIYKTQIEKMNPVLLDLTTQEWAEFDELSQFKKLLRSKIKTA